MNAAELLRRFGQVSEAPEGMARLRRLVLELAVRGRLVAQDPKDEPVRDLLLRFETAKSALVGTGELRKPRELDRGADLEAPFEIPETWTWVRLDTVGAVVGGGTPPAGDLRNFASPGTGIPWLTPADLGGQASLFVSRGSRDLTEKGLAASSATVMPAGTVLFTSRAPIGYVAVASNPVATNQGFKSVVPYLRDCSRFLALVLRAFAPRIAALAPGTTFKEVSGKAMASIAFPLPPLQEQQRIVAKVDELLSVCDKLETARTLREVKRDRLTTATLSGFAAPETARLLEHLRFTTTALPALTARTHQVKQLRQAILALAMRGRLLPQTAGDEPAAQILARLAALKRELIATKKIRQGKVSHPLGELEAETEIPAGWAWAKVDDVCYKVTDGTHFTPHYTTTGVRFVSAKDIVGGKLVFTQCKFISQEEHQQLYRRCNPEYHDIVISKSGSIGSVALVEDREEFSLFESLALLKFDQKSIDPDFLVHALRHACTSLKSAHIRGIGVKHLHLDVLRGLSLALPPLAEQHRIVEKLKHAFSVCDRLEANIALVETHRSALFETLTRDALAHPKALKRAA